MPAFILDDATGIGSDDLDAAQAFIDLVIIANDDGIGLNDPVGGMQQVTYNRTINGAPQLRLDALVNTAFTPDYGSGPQNVDIIVIAGLSGFTLDDGTSFANNGTALPPASSGLPGAGLNTTENCLVIYDTQQTICVARDGTDGDIDLPISNPVVLYHEFSHAFRIVNNTLLALTAQCDPSSPEENAAIVDENDLRTDIANRQGVTPELRDPGIHCGKVDEDCRSCCIIATVVSKSFTSPQVQFLRSVRDRFVRSTEVGYAFCEQFFRDYYSFSPQVCTIIAGNPSIPGHLLEGYINPLLDFWKVMIERSDQHFSDAQLGAAFVRHHSDRAQAEARLDALHRTVMYWLTQDSNDSEVPEKLITLLRDRAWPSDHIQWALVAPVRIYHDLLTLYLDGADEETIGRELNRALESWAPEVPISEVWASLPAEQVVKELEFCDNALLQSPGNKKLFHQRLRDRFRDITSIGVVLNSMTDITGGAR
ncbi:MAG: CFI-box-CTERM domain-containing protein [Gammaproteobacteria bacterium]